MREIWENENPPKMNSQFKYCFDQCFFKMFVW